MVDSTPVPLRKFLESHPPGGVVAVSHMTQGSVAATQSRTFIYPQIVLHCQNEECGGLRNFSPVESYQPLNNDWLNIFLTYICRNCGKFSKIFALRIRHTSEADGEAIKLGEWPLYGPLVPPRVISLIGPDRDLFLQGRRAESRGLGIGAFAYYRRVVENQWKRILDEIIRVAKRTNAPLQAIARLERAEAETLFSRAVELAKDAVPPSLLIDGHNPLVLLYRALSEGLHEGPEEECLELATSIRVLLTDLADQIGQALKEKQELKKAMSKLLGEPKVKKPEVPG